MTKILCLIESLASGGAERQMVNLACLLQKNSFEVFVLCYYQNEFFLPILQQQGVRYECVSHAKPIIRRLFDLNRILNREKPDALIAFMNTPSTFACLLKWLHPQINVIVSERNFSEQNDFRQRLKFFMYRFADHIVSNSYTQAMNIKNRYGNLSDKLCVITNWVDVKRFKRETNRTYLEDGKLEVTRFLIVGRRVGQKNVIRFLEAVASVRQRGYNFVVKWVGPVVDVLYNKQIRETMEKLELGDIVQFEDPTYDIVSEYSMADVFCLPSIYEGTSNVICEAMCNGLPVLCGNICDNPRWVENQVNGFLFDPYDVQSIAQAMMNFMDLPSERKQAMSERNIMFSESIFAPEQFVSKYIALIE